MQNIIDKKSKNKKTLADNTPKLFHFDTIDLIVPSSVNDKIIGFNISKCDFDSEYPFIVNSKVSPLYELQPHSIKFTSPVTLKFKNVDFENRNICLFKQEHDENFRLLNKWNIYYPTKKVNGEVEFELVSFSFAFLGEIDIKIRVNTQFQFSNEELNNASEEYIHPGLNYQIQCRCSDKSRILNQNYGEFKLNKNPLLENLKVCQACRTIESIKSMILFQAEAKIDFKLELNMHQEAKIKKEVTFEESSENNLIVFGNEKFTEKFEFINFKVYKNLLKYNNTVAVLQKRINLSEQLFPEAPIKINNRFIYKSFEPNVNYVIKQASINNQFPYGTEQLSHVYEFFESHSLELNERINLKFKIEEFPVIFDDPEPPIKIVYKQENDEIDRILNYWTGHLPFESDKPSNSLIEFKGLPLNNKHHLYLSTLSTLDQISSPGLKYLVNCDFKQCDGSKSLMIINQGICGGEIRPFVHIANGSLKCPKCEKIIDNRENIKAFIICEARGIIKFRIYENHDNQTVHRDFKKEFEIKEKKWIHFTNPNRQLAIDIYELKPKIV